METKLSLETIDVDGTVRQAAEDAGAMTDRRDLVRRGVLAAGAVGAGTLFGPMLSPAEAAISSKKSAKNDIKILQYALTLEYLEREFYRRALGNLQFSNPQFKFFAQVVALHEADHVTTLRAVLGKKAFQVPGFDFKDATTNEAKFLATSQILEDTGVAAYAGQGPNLLNKTITIAALGIHSVEARHAAWIRALNGGLAPGSGDKAPAPVAFDAPLTESAVLTAVQGTGFLAG